MTFFNAANIQNVLGGTWLRHPDETMQCDGIGTDSRENLKGRAFIALRGDTHDGHDHLRSACAAGATLLLVERCDLAAVRNSVAVLKVTDTRTALAQLAAAYRKTLTRTTVIAVTGSSGKTTTKEMIHAALQTRFTGSRAAQSFNNDIGVPLTILSASPDDDYLVLEIGMNQPGEIAALGAIAQPDIAVITTVGPAHLAGLGSMQAIAHEKASLLGTLATGGLAVVNCDHTFERDVVFATANCMRFGAAEHADIRLTEYGSDDAQQVWWFDVNNSVRFRLPMPGRHNACNALAAVAIARHLGVPDNATAAGLLQVQLPGMRMHRQSYNGVTVYNDAYNANPQSMRASIEAFLETTISATRRILVLGDMLELGADAAAMHEQLGRELLECSEAHHIERIVLIGELMRYTAGIVGSRWGDRRVQWAGELDQNVIHRIWRQLTPGDAVLLKASRSMQLERVVTQRPEGELHLKSAAVA